MNTFRVKPIEVQAARWDGTAEGATPIIDWVLGAGATAAYICSDVDRCTDVQHRIKVEDANGQFFVHVGEWLVRDEYGQFDRYSPAAFDAKYEPADR